MRQQTFYRDPSSVYPGKYTHFYEGVHFKRMAKKPKKTFFPGTSDKIEDLGNCYLVELPLPGITREEFVVEADGSVLTVVVIPSDHGRNDQKNLPTEGFSFGKYFLREILLPQDADPQFVSAKYNAGTLEIFVPKSKYPVRKVKTKIAVY